MCIIFIGSVFIDPGTCPRACQQFFSETYPIRTYVCASPAVLWKVMKRVAVFVTSPVVINTLIGFKAVPKFLQVCSFVGKCQPKGEKIPLGKSLANVCVTS